LLEIVKSNLDLATCSVSDLEKIRGIGPKTARMFVLCARPNQKLAVLDTHILSFMREELGINTPKILQTKNSIKNQKKLT